MFLSWANKLALAIVMLFPISAHADLTRAEGRYALPDNISKDECYSNALLEAKKHAMSMNRLETLSSEQTEICLDTNEKTICELHQQTLNNYEKGYLVGTKITNKEVQADECIIQIETEVKKFANESDPNFALLAEIDGPKRVRNGERIVVSGDTNISAHLMLLGWYPNSDEDYVQRIIPNQFEDIDNFSHVQGKFTMPSKKGQNTYAITAQFPEQIKKDEVSEMLIVLATKKKFDVIDKESAESFYQRLDELGKHNWKIQKLSYWIFREK